MSSVSQKTRRMDTVSKQRFPVTSCRWNVITGTFGYSPADDRRCRCRCKCGQYHCLYNTRIHPDLREWFTDWMERYRGGECRTYLVRLMLWPGNFPLENCGCCVVPWHLCLWATGLGGEVIKGGLIPPESSFHSINRFPFSAYNSSISSRTLIPFDTLYFSLFNHNEVPYHHYLPRRYCCRPPQWLWQLQGP